MEASFDVNMEVVMVVNAGEGNLVNHMFVKAQSLHKTCQYHMHDDETPKCKQRTRRFGALVVEGASISLEKLSYCRDLTVLQQTVMEIAFWR